MFCLPKITNIHVEASNVINHSTTWLEEVLQDYSFLKELQYAIGSGKDEMELLEITHGKVELHLKTDHLLSLLSRLNSSMVSKVNFSSVVPNVIPSCGKKTNVGFNPNHLVMPRININVQREIYI